MPKRWSCGRRERRAIECNNTIDGEARGGGLERIETEQIKKKEAVKERREGGKSGGLYVLSDGLQWWSSCCCAEGVSRRTGREENDRGCLFPG